MKRLLGGLLLALLPATGWAQGIPPSNGTVPFAMNGVWGNSAASGGSSTVFLAGNGAWLVPSGGGGGGGITSLNQGSGITLSPNPIVSTGTVTCTTFSSSLVGCVPASGGGTSNFLRADGTWAAPPGGGGGVTSITFNSPLTGGTITTSGSVGLGNIPVSNLASGTGASSTTFWRGDGVWATPAGSGGNVNAGGTLTANQLVIGAGTQNIAALGSLGTTTTLLHGNASGAPTFGPVNLTNDTTGPVPVAQGGTGWVGGTQHATVVAGGTGAALTSAGPGTAGFVLTSNGPSVDPTYQASSTGSMFAAPFGGTGTAYTATATGFTLTAGNGIQGTLTTQSGASPTLNVNGLGAKPIVFNTAVGLAALGPGGILNPTTTSFVYDGTNFVMQSVPQTGPPITASHTVTVGEWTTCQPFAINTAAQTITLPIATSIPTGGCIQIQPQGVTVSLQPNGADGINGMSVGTPVTIPVGITTVVTTSGASGTGAFKVPAGPAQYFNIGWSAGQNLMTSGSSATNGIPFGRSLTPRTIYGVNCMIPLAAGGTASFDIYATASGAAPNAGSKVNTTACDGNTAANTEQDMGVNTTQIPANYWFWLVATSWPTGTTSTGTGDVSVTFR